ncbi:MAG TPA: hypothetical protein VMG12_18955 [Polyangiaceae bacterium]|nr:hypothetical protein [Polyangiaceae bacterium]
MRMRAAFGLWVLAMAGGSDAEPLHEATPCWVSGVAVQPFAGSRLFEAPGDRLELLAGHSLDCGDAALQPVLAAIAQALEGLPPEPFRRPLRVHLSPRLPPRQAPIAGVEVHVTRRELLVAPAALEELQGRQGLGELAQEMWRHELLHALAPAPPELPLEARRLWLTLEEGLVTFVARASLTGGRTLGVAASDFRGAPGASQAESPATEVTATRDDAGTRARRAVRDGGSARDDAPNRGDAPAHDLATDRDERVALDERDVELDGSAHLERAARDDGSARDELASGQLGARLAVPLEALLASPAYDPHPLAAGLALELARDAARVPLGDWLDCISARPSEVAGSTLASKAPAGASALPARRAASDVFRAFVGRCTADRGRALDAAIARWWVDEPAPSPRRSASSALKATARAEDSR